jgi:hypothetical protein
MPLIKFKNRKNKQEKYDFCFVCYEKAIPNEKKPLKLKTQKYYIKSCTCDGLIHKKCLDTWYNLTQKCPICKELIFNIESLDEIFEVNDPVVINEVVNNPVVNNPVVNNERHTIIYLFHIERNKYNITKFIVILCFLFYIYNLYLSIINFSVNKYYKKMNYI